MSDDVERHDQHMRRLVKLRAVLKKTYRVLREVKGELERRTPEGPTDA